MRVQRVGFLALVLLCAAMAMAPASASAAYHPFERSFGSFANPQGLATDSSENIYVLDVGTQNVQRFDSEGNPLDFSSLGSNALTGGATPAGFFNFEAATVQLALDDTGGPNDGNLYVTDSGNQVVDIFDAASGEYLGQLTEADGSSFSYPCGVAVDPSGRVYVAEFGGNINRYDPAGSPVTNADFDAKISGLAPTCQIAVDGDGNVFGAPWYGGKLNKYPASQFGEAGSGTVIVEAANSAAVAPDGDLYVAHNTSVEQFSPGGESLGSFGGDKVKEARGITVSPAGDILIANVGSGTVAIYKATPPAALPTVESTTVVPARTEAKLQATIAPGNVEATYRFEYGATPAYGSSTLSASIPAGGTGVAVSAPILGLTPGTTYYFRVVATNSEGTVAGPGQTFATLPAQAAGSCPNELFRQGPSALLTECRAWEMVSPVDKNGGSVNTKTSVRSNLGGSEVAFYSSAPFAGAPSNTLSNAYLAQRGGEDWATQSLNVPQLNPSNLVGVATSASSPDLSKSFTASKIALTPGATAGGSNVYIRDNRTGGLTLIATAPGNKLFEDMVNGGSAPFVGASEDWSHVVFDTSEQLLPEAPAGVSNLYEFTDGELRLVNYLPDGSASFGAHGGNSTVAEENVVSVDGERIIFTASYFGEGPLYMRESGEKTVAISESQRAGEEGVVANAIFAAASADGSVVYFTSMANLTKESETRGGPTLYRFEVETGALTDLTQAPAAPNGADVEKVLAVGGDASYVYFAAHGSLVDGVEEAPRSVSANIYVWHEGEIRFLAQTDPLTQEFAGPNQRLASQDGRYFAMGSFSKLTDEAVPSPNCPTDPFVNNPPETCRDVYLWSYASGELSCVSCDGPGAGFSSLGGQEFRIDEGIGDIYPRAVLNDGAVFFDTPNKLLGADVNGVGDVYSWKDGAHTLISPGTGSYVANFGDATPDGSSVFIRTPQPLVKQDIDQSGDIYAARIDGGLAGQNPPGAPPPCSGEACRGQQPPPAPGLTPGSTLRKAGGNAGGKSCAAIANRAKRAGSKASSLNRQAKKAAKPSQARRLHKQATKEQKRAKRLRTQAHKCGGNNR